MYRNFFETEKERFSLTTADCGEAAIKLLEEESFDVVILDWTLPEVSGVDVLSRIRLNHSNKFTLVFVVTGSGNPNDLARALNCGADDYLVKPFSMAVLKAKLNSLLRRREMALAEFDIFEAGDLKLSPGSDYAEVGGKQVRLFIKEIELLKVFLKRSNMIVTPESLWEAVWGYDSPNWKHTLETTMSSLRAKLGEKWAKRIETRRGMGYLLNTRIID